MQRARLLTKDFLFRWLLGVLCPLILVGVSVKLAIDIHPYFYVFAVLSLLQTLSHIRGNIQASRKKEVSMYK